MQKTTAEPMEPSEQFCPNLACCARGQIGLGNIAIHDRKRQRYRCKTCKHTTSREARNDVGRAAQTERVEDRKSTRLNSSHSQISYAVFCLKKKKKHTLHVAV